MGAESQASSNPLIEFHAIGHQRFPAPYPAGRNIPDWYKDLQIEVKSTRSDEIIPTIKRCPPFLEAITCGYIIPLADDVHFSTDARATCRFNQEMMSFTPMRQCNTRGLLSLRESSSNS